MDNILKKPFKSLSIKDKQKFIDTLTDTNPLNKKDILWVDTQIKKYKSKLK